MAANHFYYTAVLAIALSLPVTVSGKTVYDSLSNKQFSYLFSKIISTKGKPTTQQLYLRAFLRNAKAEKDWELIMTGYKNYADHSEGHIAINYIDSLVYAAKQSENDKLIGSAYLSKGIAFYALKRHEVALENYLLAKPLIEKSGDEYLKYKLKYNIAHVKYYLGKNEDAIQLFNSCLSFFKSNNARAYLNTLHSLGLCYTKSGDYGKSETLVALGLREAARLNNHSMDAYFRHLKGQNDFFSRNFASAIHELGSTIPAIEENGDYANVAVANFYIGKSYWAMRKFKEGVPYFQKVALTFEQKEYMRPDLRENFELLIDYYKAKNDYQKTLYYVDRLLEADSLLLKTHDNLYDNIHKNYDTSELILEKQHIEKQLLNEAWGKKLISYAAYLLLGISCIIFIIYERNRRRQNRLYRELMAENKKETLIPLKNASKELEIAQETVDKILHLLEKWEMSKRFLEPDITQTTLAVYLETNTRYVSDIILNYRGKKFNEYINDLKVDYVVEELKADKLKRMYTHDALAKEAGFSTTRRFVQAFRARTGLSPNFFSEKIRKEMMDNQN